MGNQPPENRSQKTWPRTPAAGRLRTRETPSPRAPSLPGRDAAPDPVQPPTPARPRPGRSRLADGGGGRAGRGRRVPGPRRTGRRRAGNPAGSSPKSNGGSATGKGKGARTEATCGGGRVPGVARPELGSQSPARAPARPAADTHREAGPERAGVADAGRGGERQRGEAHGHDEAAERHLRGPERQHHAGAAGARAQAGQAAGQRAGTAGRRHRAAARPARRRRRLTSQRV